MPRFTLHVRRYKDGCAQYQTFEGLRESEIEQIKGWQIETHLGYDIAFDVEKR